MFLFKRGLQPKPAPKPPVPPPTEDSGLLEAADESESDDESAFAVKKGRSRKRPNAIRDVGNDDHKKARSRGRRQEDNSSPEASTSHVFDLDGDDEDALANQRAKERAQQELREAELEAEAQVAGVGVATSGTGKNGKPLSKRAAKKAATAAAVAEAVENAKSGAEINKLQMILSGLQPVLKQSNRATSTLEIDLVDDEDNVVRISSRPKILTAAEREAQALAKSTSHLDNILGTSSSSSVSQAQEAVLVAVQTIKLKTRLNGKSEFKWKFNTKEKFSIIKEKFAQNYDLDVKDILKWEFDGEEVDDDETPEGLGMEDFDIIDVKIKDSKYEVVAATTQKDKPTAAVFTTTKAAPTSILVVIDIDATVTSSGGESISLDSKIPLSKTFDKLMIGLKNKSGLINPNVPVAFYLHGLVVDPEKTVQEAGTKEGDRLVIRQKW